jgi:hypothetical protein
MKDVGIARGSIRDFVTELENAGKAYRGGAEKDDMVMARLGALSALAALLKLAEGVLAAAGASEVRQGELFLSVRALHSAVFDLNRRVQHPRLLRPMPVDSRPPTVELSEVMWRADLVAAYELWVQVHRGSGKSKDLLADEVARKFGDIQGKSIRKYYRTAVSGADRRLTERYREMLRLAKTEFPGGASRAAEALIESAKGLRAET